MKQIQGGVCAPKGYKAAGIHCGIRKNRDRRDLALIVCEKDCEAAAVYTTNRVKAAPVYTNMQHLKNGRARAIICNSGNANACAPNGMQAAKQMCEITSRALGIATEDVFVCSTGVIGVELDVTPIKNAMPDLVSALSINGGADAAQAILTTDTIKKEIAVSFMLGDKEVRIGGIAKGSGMIHPNMGTMLCFITTDADITHEMLDAALRQNVNKTFNRISVDGDTSTNDTAVVFASGLAGNSKITERTADFDLFADALYVICEYLAKAIARDGEGATHLVSCTVSGAESEQVAEQLAKSVICSSLIKAAMFGADANWGRVICAMGYSGCDFAPEQVEISFRSCAGIITVCANGEGLPFDEEVAKNILTQDEVEILISLSAGDASVTAWGCDLTYDYVKINGDYRT